MKIKNGVKSISPVAIFIMLAVATLIAMPLRTYQIFNIIDPETGFYKSDDVTIIILYVFLLVAIIALFIMSFLCGNYRDPVMYRGKNKAIGISSLMFAVLLLIDTAFKMNEYIALYQSAGSTSESVGRYIISSGALFLTLESVFALISALYLVIFSMSYFTGERKFENARVIAIVPVIWAIMRIIYRFIKPVSFKNVSQLLLEIVMLVFIMGFLLSLARIASEVNQEKSMWLLFGCGSISCMLSFVCAFSPFAALITGNPGLISDSYPLQYCDLGYAVFSMTVLGEMLSNSKSKGE